MRKENVHFLNNGDLQDNCEKKGNLEEEDIYGKIFDGEEETWN